MKYIILIAILSLCSFADDAKTDSFQRATNFNDVIIHNTFIIGENGDFETLSEALNSALVKDQDQILINTNIIDEGEIIINKNVIIKSAYHLKNEVTIIGKITIDNSHVILDNIKINNINDNYGTAIHVDGGSLTVYEHLELLGKAIATEAEVNNYGKLEIIEK